MKFLSSNLFARLTSYPGIALGLFSDASKALRQTRNGNLSAAIYTATGGVANAIGSVIVLEGGLAIAGATSVVPFAGWAAAALVLAGALIVVGGLYLHAKAYEHIHRAIELWTARSIFGNHLNDGETRPDVHLTFEKKLPPYPSLQAEIRAWHEEHYAPKLLSAKQARSLGVEHIDTSWRNRPHWTPANDWLPASQKNTQTPAVEFSVFLPGFLLGISTWSGHLETFSGSDGPEAHTEPATVYLIAAGLIVHYKKTLTAQHSAKLTLTYMANQRLDSETENHSTFKFER